MRLAPSYPHPDHISIRVGGTDTKTARIYAEEGTAGAGSFRGYFRVPVDAYIQRESVLDLGSGSGGRSAYWKNVTGASRVTGLDIFPEEVIAAHKAVSKMDVPVSFTVGFGEKMPFRDHAFGVILSLDVLEHVRNPKLVLQECHRVMAPGGSLLLVFPPYYHPAGHHLSFVTRFPWLQVLNPVAVTMAFNDIVHSRGPEAYWYKRGPIAAYERLGWLNGLTIAEFARLVSELNWEVAYWDNLPLFAYGWIVKKHPRVRILSRLLAGFTRLPGLREFLTHRVVCILRKGY